MGIGTERNNELGSYDGPDGRPDAGRNGTPFAGNPDFGILRQIDGHDRYGLYDPETGVSDTRNIHHPIPDGDEDTSII